MKRLFVSATHEQTWAIIRMNPVAYTIIILRLSYDDHHEWCLYYKLVVALALALDRIINYANRVMLQIVASLTDDPRGIIYYHEMFIIQATGLSFEL